MTVDQLEIYHQTLAKRHGELSTLKQNLLDEKTPLEQALTAKKNEILRVNEAIRHARVEIANVKYSIKVATTQ